LENRQKTSPRTSSRRR